MFCPSCGTEERQTSQFCRACGADMRVVRTALQKPDAVTASAISAREDIGRAIAAKIHEAEGSKDLKRIAEDVLPQIEKFLESPEERRLRQLRTGVITAFIGLGATVFLLLLSFVLPKAQDIPWPAGLVPFFIGLGIFINGLYFTIPAKRVPDRRQDARAQGLLDQSQTSNTSEIETTPPGQVRLPPPSVTENTTYQLPNQPVAAPRVKDTH